MNGVNTNKKSSQSQELSLTLVHFFIRGPNISPKDLQQTGNKCFKMNAKE